MIKSIFLIQGENMLRAHSQFATKPTPFDLSRMISHVNQQYRDYLKKLGFPNSGMKTCQDQDKTGYSTIVQVVSENIFILTHMHDFFKSKGVNAELTCSTSDNKFYLQLTKNTLALAPLSEKEEGEYLFSLNQMLNKHLPTQLQQSESQQPAISLGASK